MIIVANLGIDNDSKTNLKWVIYEDEQCFTLIL